MRLVFVLTLLLGLPFIVSNTMPLQNTLIIKFDNSEETQIATQELLYLNPDAQIVFYQSFDYILTISRTHGTIYLVGHGYEDGIAIDNNLDQIVSWDRIVDQMKSSPSQDINFVACNSFEAAQKLGEGNKISAGFPGNVDAIYAARYASFLSFYSRGMKAYSQFVFDLLIHRQSQIMSGAEQYTLGCLFTQCFDDGGGGGGGGGGSPPGVPTNLGISLTDTNRLKLTWGAASGTVEYYYIYRRVAGTSSWSQVAQLGLTARQWTDTSANPSTSYEYRMKATNPYGSGSYTGVVSDFTCAYSYQSYILTIDGEIGSETGGDQHIALAGSYGGYYLVNPRAYAWAGMAAWTSFVIAMFRYTLKVMYEVFDTLDDVTDIAMAVLAGAAIGSLLTGNFYAFVLSVVALVVTKIIDIIVDLTLPIIERVRDDFEALFEVGGNEIHRGTLAYIADYHENNVCRERVLSFDPFGSELSAALIKTKSSNDATWRSGFVEFLVIEQTMLIVPIYDVWVPTASSWSLLILQYITFVQFGFHEWEIDINPFDPSTWPNPFDPDTWPDLSFIGDFHFFRSEMQGYYGYAPDFLNENHRVDWADNFLLEDWVVHEQDSDVTTLEQFTFNTLSQQIGGQPHFVWTT